MRVTIRLSWRTRVAKHPFDVASAIVAISGTCAIGLGAGVGVGVITFIGIPFVAIDAIQRLEARHALILLVAASFVLRRQ